MRASSEHNFELRGGMTLESFATRSDEHGRNATDEVIEEHDSNTISDANGCYDAS